MKRMTPEEVAAKEKELGRRLTLAEQGVYGRPATPEEAVRLKAFAAEYVANEPARREHDLKVLKRWVKKYAKQLKEAKRAKFNKWIRKHCITIAV